MHRIPQTKQASRRAKETMGWLERPAAGFGSRDIRFGLGQLLGLLFLLVTASYV
jgi:hypothetical protein